jgi:small basic protein
MNQDAEFALVVSSFVFFAIVGGLVAVCGSDAIGLTIALAVPAAACVLIFANAVRDMRK